jgi:uncharacterized protein YegP (UPF0339 family)
MSWITGSCLSPQPSTQPSTPADFKLRHYLVPSDRGLTDVLRDRDDRDSAFWSWRLVAATGTVIAQDRGCASKACAFSKVELIRSAREVPIYCTERRGQQTDQRRLAGSGAT